MLDTHNKPSTHIYCTYTSLPLGKNAWHSPSTLKRLLLTFRNALPLAGRCRQTSWHSTVGASVAPNTHVKITSQPRAWTSFRGAEAANANASVGTHTKPNARRRVQTQNAFYAWVDREFERVRTQTFRSKTFRMYYMF